MVFGKVYVYYGISCCVVYGYDGMVFGIGVVRCMVRMVYDGIVFCP